MTDDSRTQRRYLLFGFLSVCLLSCFSLYLIITNGVNVPYGDEYALTGLLGAVRTGHLSLETFWAPHNEHRIFLPRVAFTVLFNVVGWNSVGMMLVSWFVITGAGLVLFLGFRKVFEDSKSGLWLATVVLSFSLLFSPVQRENWLWAFQVAFFLVQAGVILSLFSACATSRSLAFRLAMSILFAVFASLSSAAGLMAWPALITAFALTEDTRRRMLVALSISSGAMFCMYSFYFTNYKTPSYGHIALVDVLSSPGLPLSYFVALLGNPLTFWVSDTVKPLWATVTGSILILLFCWFCYLNIRNGQRKKAAPWIVLALFSSAFCLITTLGRSDIGLTTGLATSRYTTHALLFTIAVLGSGYLAFNDRGGLGNFAKYPIIGVFLFSAGIGIVRGYIDGFQRSTLEHRARLSAKALLPFLSYFEPGTDGIATGPFFALWPALNMKIYDSLLRPYVESGCVQMKNDLKFVSSETRLKGRCSISGRTDLPTANVSIYGTIRCEPSRSPSFVFLKEETQSKFIGATALGVDKSSDHEKRYKWQLPLSAQFLAGDDKELEMWVYDKTMNAFLKVESVCDQLTPDLAVNWQTTKSAECVIDAINRKPLTDQPIVGVNGTLLVQGWAAVAAERGLAADEVFVILVGDDGSFRVAPAEVIPRPDVNAHFKHPEMGPTGFDALLDTSKLKGDWTLRIYVRHQNKLFASATTVRIRL